MNSSQLRLAVTVVIAVLLGGLGFTYRAHWFPHVKSLVAMKKDAQTTRSNDSKGEHDSHNHVASPSHATHDDSTSIKLSRQALKNIGLTTTQIVLSDFDKTVSMPALVVERPGRSQIEVTAPLGGRVVRVHPVQGEAVMPGDRLFDLRLTHEDLVKAQSDLLRSAEELDVVNREITRLESVNVPGAIPGKTKRERQYEQQKLKAILNAQKQSLVLHGLTSEQVVNILENRKLLQGVTVVAPPYSADDHDGEPDHPFHVQLLSVKPGQYVEAGNRLCVLADHHELMLEGRAFEQDIEELNRAARQGWPVSATRTSGNGEQESINGLKIFYLADVVETESRAFHFYVRVPNQIVQDATDESGHRFISWRFKPGQRMQIHVPVERWEGRVVLPVDAVAQQGVETFVFQQNDDHFDRVPVHVEHRDKEWVVIEDDGQLTGKTIAVTGAHQLQMEMALTKKSNNPVDPHAGHNH